MQDDENKALIYRITGEVMASLRGEKSRCQISSENGISTSILSMVERGLKDPQLTTVFKLCEALGVKASDFIKMVEEKLPEGFTLLDK